jgi:hypothetical protein
MNIEVDEKTGCYSYSQSHDVNKGKNFSLPKITKCGFEVVSYHKGPLAASY